MRPHTPSLGLSIVAALVASSAVGCGWFGTPSRSASEATTAEPEAGTTARDGEAPAEAPKSEPPADLNEAMAPPDGLFDVRPIFGTDASTEKPAFLGDVNAGMKGKDLEATFPGVGKAFTPGAVDIEFAKVGEKWIYWVKAKEPLKERLHVSLLDDGTVWRIDYTFDPAVVSDEFWMYAQKAAKARWGKPRGDIGPGETLVSFKPKTLRDLILHRDGTKVRLEVDLRRPS